MKNLFSSFSSHRNASGQLEIEFGALIGPYLLLALFVPPAGAGFGVYSLSGPFGTPWYILWAGIGAAIFAAAVLLLVFAPRSRARIVIDRASGVLTVESAGKRKEWPLKDVARAEIVSVVRENTSNTESDTTTITIGSTTTTVYQLKLILHSGKEIATTDGYFSAFPEAARKRTVDAINQELV